MNRKKETLIYILAVIILFGVFMKFGGRYFTPAAVARANELGLHYGPSQKVLLEYKGSENDVLVIGKVDDRSLSVIPAKRSFGIFWRLKGGGISGLSAIDYDEDKVAAWYSSNFQLAYGITDLKEADSVQFSVEYKNNEMEDFALNDGYTAKVDEDGFFYLPIEKMDDESWYYVRNISVYDKDGNEIYTLEK